MHNELALQDDCPTHVQHVDGLDGAIVAIQKSILRFLGGASCLWAEIRLQMGELAPLWFVPALTAMWSAVTLLQLLTALRRSITSHSPGFVCAKIEKLWAPRSF